MPAISGAEPWMGSYNPKAPSFKEALGSNPKEPGNTEALDKEEYASKELGDNLGNVVRWVLNGSKPLTLQGCPKR